MKIPWRKAGTNFAFWVWSLFMIALGALITTWAVPENDRRT
jgi:heme exporter protein D